MKINKNLIKELTEYLDEFNLTELEYTEKDIKVKVRNLNSMAFRCQEPSFLSSNGAKLRFL